MLTWMLARLHEPSTWRGIVWLLTALGVQLAPEAWEYLIVAGMALAGLLGVVFADDPKTIKIQLPPVDRQDHSDAGDAALGPDDVRSADHAPRMTDVAALRIRRHGA